ncbi:glycosyltransferase family 4 protein [Psychroflexus sediminis]|uniref:Glycosyltransferase involved in cell wall bisynthesis n=1 Tax=Psychroflexus sediminis TaxID=470826 RepID=A0A1G7UJM5_9FLAO|nr:glycosyltransferase family 4 protein [Psychroflexus sediminis]SDG47451.1 Glycosyltransferase involved in cell wall bisynthesis [Psychroflexus sediminis]
MKEIKVLHVVAGSLNGGAAKGAYWQHQGLLEIGVDSRVLINSREVPSDENVTSIIFDKKSLIRQAVKSQLDQLPLKFYENDQRSIFSVGFFGHDITKHDWYKWADVINLHWINAGFISIKGIGKIKKPIVWTLRDMWPFTGGCHYSLGCENYKTGCGSCFQLGSANKHDLSRMINLSKQKKLPKSMKLVGISNWISQQAIQSSVFKNFDVRTIFNNINCSEFYPIDKKNSREVLGFPANKKIILVGAQNINDFYKGFNKYLGAISSLAKKQYFLVFFGNLDESLLKNIEFEYKNFGFLNDSISLNLLYSCADVFVAPSIMDAFGKTIGESMACGTPVVCFDSTGPKDIVDHKINGYKAKPYQIEDLREGITWVLENDEKQQELSRNAIKKVKSTFDSKIIASQYLKLYEECLEINM